MLVLPEHYTKIKAGIKIKFGWLFYNSDFGSLGNLFFERWFGVNLLGFKITVLKLYRFKGGNGENT